MTKAYVSPFASAAKSEPKPTRPERALPAPVSDPGQGKPPKPRGIRKARYNFTVRLSEDERERLKAIGRKVGRPEPLGDAETVRWLIKEFNL